MNLEQILPSMINLESISLNSRAETEFEFDQVNNELYYIILQNAKLTTQPPHKDMLEGPFTSPAIYTCLACIDKDNNIIYYHARKLTPEQLPKQGGSFNLTIIGSGDILPYQLAIEKHGLETEISKFDGKATRKNFHNVIAIRSLIKLKKRYTATLN